MKKLVFTCALILTACVAFSQDKAKPSPAAQAEARVDGRTITIDYHQPAVKGREIWGALVPYGKVWRAGANETTSITVSEDATIDGKSLPEGKYALFVIPNEKEWTIIINKTIKWGAYSYNEKEDVLRITIPVNKSEENTERLTYDISDEGEVSLRWEHAVVSFKVDFE